MATPGTLENAFESVETSAVTAARSAGTVQRMANGLKRAAQHGDIAAIRRQLDRLGEANSTLRQDISNAIASWHLSNSDLEGYLANDFERELIEHARAAGLEIHRQDDRLVAYPSLLRVLPSARATEIDHKRNPMLRPTRLVQLLLANQRRKPSQRPERFLEILYGAYRLVAQGELGGTVALSSVYDALTILPAARKEYSKADFTRDLYELDVSGVERTKSGARLTLPASTGTKSTRNLLSFISPDGERIAYYGIRFSEAI